MEPWWGRARGLRSGSGSSERVANQQYTLLQALHVKSGKCKPRVGATALRVLSMHLHVYVTGLPSSDAPGHLARVGLVLNVRRSISMKCSP